MVHPGVIDARLSELGFRASRWFQAEVKELQHVLMENENIIALACGRYFGSFALLVATDQRLLLIDKRMFFMNYEDTRYDMISEIEFNSQIYCSTLSVFTMNKAHRFTSIKHKKELRVIANYIQRRVADLRNQSLSSPMQEQAQAPVTQSAPSAPTQYATNVSDNTSTVPAFSQHEVAQVVGSAAIQASNAHHWPMRRPFHPYVQGSLMTRHPGGHQAYQQDSI
ncbi:PH domain-containing protein [Candidatus Saccharibacteria bacterium]|nr:PH domain-containing protein [Candidatus Saccharibacteria bacterium]